MIGSKKTLVEKAVIILGIGILLFSFFSGVAKKLRTEFIPRVSASLTSIDLKKAMERVNSIVEAKTEILPKEELRDIFSAYEYLKGLQEMNREPDSPVSKMRPDKKPKFALEGIIYGGNKNLAIISGSVVAEGETVLGARVKSISPEGVTLERGAEEIQLKR